MMNSVSPYKYIRIESAKLGTRGVCYLASVFVFAVAACLTAGLLGPDMLRIQSGATLQSPIVHGDAIVKMTANSFNSLNQYYWINVKLYAGDMNIDGYVGSVAMS
jgi:hypothetical protein